MWWQPIVYEYLVPIHHILYIYNFVFSLDTTTTTTSVGKHIYYIYLVVHHYFTQSAQNETKARTLFKLYFLVQFFRWICRIKKKFPFHHKSICPKLSAMRINIKCSKSQIFTMKRDYQPMGEAFPWNLPIREGKCFNAKKYSLSLIGIAHTLTTLPPTWVRDKRGENIFSHNFDYWYPKSKFFP